LVVNEALGLGRGAVEAAAISARRAGDADRPAVDAGGRDADEEHAVEAGVAGGERGVAGVEVEHASRLVARGHGGVWPFSDVATRSPRATASRAFRGPSRGA